MNISFGATWHRDWTIVRPAEQIGNESIFQCESEFVTNTETICLTLVVVMCNGGETLLLRESDESEHEM